MLELFIAFYASGVAIAMWRLYYPSFRMIKYVDSHNIIARKPILSFFVVLFIFTLMLPFMAYTLLFDGEMDKFRKGFVNGVLGLNDNRK
jgi:hypothetical protein